MNWLHISTAFLLGSTLGALLLRLLLAVLVRTYRCLRIAARDACRAPWRSKPKQAWASFKWAARWEFIYGAEVQ